MYEDTKASQLVINHLTEEKFKELLENNELDQNQLYMTDDNVGYTPPLLSTLWSDHLLNDMSWLRADTFSWQSGDVYVAAYNHLASEMHIENLYAWQEEEKRNVYTKSATPAVGDSVYRESGVLYGTVQSVGADNITVNGNNFPRNSGGDILGTNAETDTVDDIAITFYRAEDGHKICLPDQEANLSSLYENTGVAWYYILDTVNKQFKLPRSKHNKYADTVQVFGNGMTLGLTNSEKYGGLVRSVGGSLSPAEDAYGDNISTSTTWGNSYVAGHIGVTTDPEKSGLIAQQAQDTDQYKYLYFYVGNFERDAVEQTAGVTTEILNSKADVDLSNMNASQSAKDTIVGWSVPDYTAGSSATQDVNYTAENNCFLYAEALSESNSSRQDVTKNIVVDGVVVAQVRSFYYTLSSIIIPCKKGSVYKFENVNSGTGTYSFIVYPCIGG